jgi:hypothetical protein
LGLRKNNYFGVEHFSKTVSIMLNEMVMIVAIMFQKCHLPRNSELETTSNSKPSQKASQKIKR